MTFRGKKCCHTKAKKFISYVRTSFDSNPKTGMDSGPTSSNNKFVESGRKS